MQQEGSTGDLEGAGAAGLMGGGNMREGSASEVGMSISCACSTGIGITGGNEGIGGASTICYNSFDLSSIYAVKYHLMTRIRLYQLSFLISTIPSPHYCFPAFSDLPVI